MYFIILNFLLFIKGTHFYHFLLDIWIVFKCRVLEKLCVLGLLKLVIKLNFSCLLGQVEGKKKWYLM